MRLAAFLLLSLAAFGQSAPAPEPSSMYGVLGGIRGLGPVVPYAGYFMAQRVGDSTWTTEVTEMVRLKGGQIGSSVRAGLYKKLWAWGSLSLGVQGDAGAAEAQTGSAGGAVAGAGVLGFRFGSTPFGMIGKAQLVNVAGSGQQTNVAIGFTFSH